VPVQLLSAGLEVTAIQFDVAFDGSVTMIAPTAGLSASGASKTINNADVTPSVLRIVLAGQNHNSIPDGMLASLLITPAFSGFSGTLNVLNIIASDPSGTALTFSAPGGPPPTSTLSIVNAASEQGGAISPGEMVSLYQSGILPPTAAAADISVTFNGTPAPILYAGTDQINAVTPFGLVGQTTASVAVMYQGNNVGQATVSVSPASPGIFTSGGSLQGAIVNQDGTLNTASNPAPIGSTVSLFATGAGVYQNPALTDGQIISSTSTPTSKPALNVGMGVGGHDVRTTYVGPAPGFVAGILQINFVISATISPGSAVPLNIGVGGIQSPQVTMAVK
jgi:uncharacterized protein (TIGR03437 family)